MAVSGVQWSTSLYDDDDDVIGLRDPASFPDAPTRFFSGGVGERVWAGWAGCPTSLYAY